MTLGALKTAVSARLDDDAAVYYARSEVVGALNEAQRVFALLTLCLEKSASFSLAAATPFVHLLPVLADFLIPLRIENATGTKLDPRRLAELDAEAAAWQKTAGDPLKYTLLGLDLLAVTPQPSASHTLSVAYAHAPTAMTNDSDTPDIPAEYHPALILYAGHVLRVKEGGQEFAKTFPAFNEFLIAVNRCAAFVRSKHLASRYDNSPAELAHFDASKVLDPNGRPLPWLAGAATP